jgi:signal transduction histidine kinase
MDTFLPQFFLILTTAPGNLIYHLIIAFCIAATLQAGLAFWRSPFKTEARRMVLGLGLILAIQFCQFFFAGVTWQGFSVPESYLPVVDRAVSIFSLVWIIWLWAFPSRKTWADILTGCLSIVTIAGLVFYLNAWMSAPSDLPFNSSNLAPAWDLSAIFLVLLGSLYLIVKRPTGWGRGLGMLLLLGLGHLADLTFLPTAGNYSGMVRLAQMAAFPMLLTMTQRYILIPIAPPRIPGPRFLGPERRRYSADPKTIHTFLKLAMESDSQKIYPVIAHAIGQAMLSDAILILSTPDPAGVIKILGGYDLVREDFIENLSFSKETAPLIASAIQFFKPLPLPSGHTTTADIKTIAGILSLDNIGNLLVVPFRREHQSIGGAILLFSPYSDRIWSDEDQAYLTSISEDVAQILQRSLKAPTNTEVRTDQSEALLALRVQSEETITRLQAENETLREMVPQPGTPDRSSELDHFERELQAALQESARLKNALANANIKILQAERNTQPGEQISHSQADGIASIIQQLRHPISAMIIQADLLIKLLGETTDTAHRAALGRMSAASERLVSLMDELMSSLSSYKSGPDVSPEMTELAGVMDEVIAFTRPQLREKNIALLIDLPDSMSPLYADRDALQQTLIYLMQNAGSATPAEGKIQITAGIRKSGIEQPYAILKMTDQGGGIPENEIPHLFSDFFSHDRSIPGVGSPQHLLMAKTLVESIGGQIWIETDPGESSTINVLIPLANNQAPVNSLATTGKR